MLALEGFMRDEATRISIEGRALGGSSKSGYSSVTRPRKILVRSVGLSRLLLVGLGRIDRLVRLLHDVQRLRRREVKWLRHDGRRRLERRIGRQRNRLSRWPWGQRSSRETGLHVGRQRW